MKKLTIIIWTLVKWALVAVVVFYGLFFLLMFYMGFGSDLETKMWPKVPAVVEETTVIRFSVSKEGNDYCPVSTVKYQLNGTSYTARLVIVDCDGLTEDLAQQAVEQWPRGKELQIHANPVKPNQVGLVGRSLNFYDFFELFLAWLFFLIASRLWKITPMDLKSRMSWKL